MKRKIVSLFVLVIVAGLVTAHEFWLQPGKFRYEVGETWTVDFMVGESFTGEFWDMKRHQAEKLQLHSVAGSVDLLQNVKKTNGRNISAKLEKEGTYLLTMQSNAAFLELGGKEFNAYLKEDGMDYILEERKNANALEASAKEHYTRFAKLIIQSGSKTDDTFKKRVGMRIEIIPQQNPYALKQGDYLQCLVFFDGKPMPHTLVKVWNRLNGRTFLQNIYTENDGSVKFPISAGGSWMVSTVRMIKAEKPGADWQSLWASLVFGIE